MALTPKELQDIQDTIVEQNYGIYVFAHIVRGLKYVTWYTAVASMVSLIDINLPLYDKVIPFSIIWIVSYIILIMFVTPYCIKHNKSK